LPWWGYEAVHEGCDHWFVFTMCITLIALLLYMSAIYVYSYVCLLFAPTAV
jgi:cbb3-type cytochrome oxidase subunit 3